MKISVERVYDITTTPKKNSILVDRLWPRGISKEKLDNIPWLKEVSPSDKLRKWFHQDKNTRWKKFNKEYLAELENNYSEIKEIVSNYATEIILLTAVKDIEKSHIPVLKKFLEKIYSH